MSKYTSKADELLERVESLAETPKTYGMITKLKKVYADILLDIQTLFFCESPQFPLYIEAMKLNQRCEAILISNFENFNESDYLNLKTLLIKYRQYREFLDSDE